VLHNAFSAYGWSSLYNDASVDATVDRLNVSLTQDTDLAIPSEDTKKHKYPPRFSGKLKCYTNSKIIVIHVSRS
jgi:hypothetical protein